MQSLSDKLLGKDARQLCPFKAEAALVWILLCVDMFPMVDRLSTRRFHWFTDTFRDTVWWGHILGGGTFVLVFGWMGELQVLDIFMVRVYGWGTLGCHALFGLIYGIMDTPLVGSFWARVIFWRGVCLYV